jgi:DNA-binding Lrp family transcriptional regulator
MFVKFFDRRGDVPPMTYENLDARLVNALLDDGRASLRSLGEQLDVSVTTVSNHLRDLEDEGVIEGYTPKVNYQKLGYDVTAVLQLKVEGSALPEITDRLADLRGMVSVYEVTGDHDVVAIAKFEDTDDMNERIKRILVDDDIRESNTSVVLNAVAENQQFELEIDEE